MVASIGCSFSGTVLLLQNHYPRFRGAPSGHFRMLTKRPPSVDSGLVAAACGGFGSDPDTTLTGQPQSEEAPLPELELVNTWADLNFPSQIQFRFAFRDQAGAPIVVPAEDIRVRVFERETGTKEWQEIEVDPISWTE